MPCWTVQTAEVNLTNPNPEVLTRALIAAGFKVNSAEYSRQFGASFTADRFRDTVSVRIIDGRMEVTAADRYANLSAVSNEVKRAYSAEIIRTASKRFGWNVTAQSETKFQVRRRF